MIMTPLRNAIEYADDAVDAVIAYCDRNPFYIHLLCSTVFQHCFSERRTYVTESDVLKLRERRVQDTRHSHHFHALRDHGKINAVPDGQDARQRQHVTGQQSQGQQHQ